MAINAEKEALEKLEEIINALGDDSPVKKAFEGCFGVAWHNVLYRTMNSQADAIKNMYKNLEEKQKQIELYAAKTENLELEVMRLKAKLYDRMTNE